MADVSKAQKLKLANSRKRFKELQELKKKKSTEQNVALPAEDSVNRQTPVDSLTNSTHSSLNDQAEENPPENSTSQLTNYFNATTDETDVPQPAVFFDSFSQGERDVSEPATQDSGNIFNYFHSTSPNTSLVQNVASNVVQTPKIEPVPSKSYFNQDYSLFSHTNQQSYLAETRQIIRPHQDNLTMDDPEIKQNEIYDFHKNAKQDTFSTQIRDRDPEIKQNEIYDFHKNAKQDTFSTQNLNNYSQNTNEVSDTDNIAIKNEILSSSDLAQAEVKHSSVESLKQLSTQMAELMGPEYSQYSSSITDLEKRNLELAALLEQERLKSEQQRVLINDLQARIVQVETENKLRDQHSELQRANESSKLKEELQCHIQTVGLLVAEKTELSAGLSQLELASKQKIAECEELQARLKASRSRVAELERENNVFKAERTRNENLELEQSETVVNLRKNCDSLREQKEELVQDFSEVCEKLKGVSEENLQLVQQNQELSGKLALADIKIQQVFSGEQSVVADEVEKLTEEKFGLEKHLSNLTLMLKTITKERDESSVQYQQYAQQLNVQITNLSNRIQQLQQENENMSVQEQNRVKHISELEKQLQNLQNEQVAFATSRTSGDASLKSELDSTREMCVQLKVEKTSTDEHLTKALNEKEMLLKELLAKNDSLYQLEIMVEQLRGNQPDSVKLLATMESDKVAAARAVQQNKELKEQMESMQEVFMKLDKDKVELTEKLNFEQFSNKELLDKLQKVELQLQRLTDAIEIKDRELSSMRDASMELDYLALQQEQLTDRLRHYEAQDGSSSALQRELQEAKQTIVRLADEVNSLRHENHARTNAENGDAVDRATSDDGEERTDQKNETDLEKVNNSSYVSGEGNFSEKSQAVLDKEEAVTCLEQKFKRTMQDIADLTEEKQRLEHLVLQLQGETETIGEYVALYQHQRMVLKQRATEKDEQLNQLARDRELVKAKLEKLNELIRKLVGGKMVSAELLAQHVSLNADVKERSEEIDEANEKDAGADMEVAEEIIALLSEIKSSNLVQHDANFHHCPWCSGQLITV